MQYISLASDASMEVSLTTTPKTLQELFPSDVIPMDTDALIMQGVNGSIRWYPADNDPSGTRGFLTTQSNFLEKSGIGNLLEWKFACDGAGPVTATVAFGKSTISRS